MTDDAASPASPPAPRRNRGVFLGVVAAAFVAAPIITLGALRARRAEPPPVLGSLPAFELTDQGGRPFGLREMTGHPWVADFVFTSCPTVCPRLTERMAGLARLASRSAPALRFVSFSVDPEHDTPEVLSAYGRKHGADFARWTFVTGPLGAMEAAIGDGFKIALSREKVGDVFELVHGEHFVLVDAQGRIRGYYTADDAGLGKLLDEAAQL